uniref:CemA family protein n=1 Tax=virus sp. ctBM815 TaxID=2825806 RepID=A0A8S5RL66_9VIRU|nr:MAG TPA: CemA family protein [virus sp. ctBM815]
MFISLYVANFPLILDHSTSTPFLSSISILSQD